MQILKPILEQIELPPDYYYQHHYNNESPKHPIEVTYINIESYDTGIPTSRSWQDQQAITITLQGNYPGTNLPRFIYITSTIPEHKEDGRRFYLTDPNCIPELQKAITQELNHWYRTNLKYSTPNRISWEETMGTSTNYNI